MSLGSSSLQEKHQSLKKILVPKVREGLLIAFSGGVDSAALLFAANEVRKEAGGKLLALTAISPSVSANEKEDVLEFIKKIDVPHVSVDSLELDNEQYKKNDSNRCYHCKTELFRLCELEARKNKLKWTAYGYTLSDVGDHRPGHQAALENKVLFPLYEAEFTKNDVRLLLKVNDFHLSEKPASPCLSSRIMTGVPVSKERLQAVEQMENILRKNGVRIFRVRLHEDKGKKFFRIETNNEGFEQVIEIREQLSHQAKSLGVEWVTLDLSGYKMGGGLA